MCFRKQKTGRAALAALSLLVLLGVTACGSRTESGSGSDEGGMASVSAEDEVSGSGQDGGGAAETDGKDLSQITFGNRAATLICNTYGPCFGDGRIYYVNQENNLCSFALDGTDPQTHGQLPEEYLESFKSLNYYQGKIYYIVTVVNEDADYSRRAEIRCVDPAAGTVETVASLGEEGGSTTANSILILNDEIFYSTFIPQESISCGVINLATGETNEFYKTSSKTGNTYAAFDTDGTYLYMYINSSVPMVRRVLLTSVYEEEADTELLLKPLNGIIPADGGFYTLVQDSDTHDKTYCFYDYGKISADGEGQALFQMAEDDGFIDDIPAEKIPLYLPTHSDMYVVGEAMASFVSAIGDLYYAPTYNYEESVLAADLSDKIPQNETLNKVLHMGVHEDTLYIVIETESGAELHALEADGTFR